MYLLMYCPWMSLLLLLYCPSLLLFFFRRARVYTRGSRVISISFFFFFLKLHYTLFTSITCDSLYKGYVCHDVLTSACQACMYTLTDSHPYPQSYPGKVRQRHHHHQVQQHAQHGQKWNQWYLLMGGQFVSYLVL